MDGVEHRPRADDEVRFLIVGTSVTSNAAGGKLREDPTGATRLSERAGIEVLSRASV